MARRGILERRLLAMGVLLAATASSACGALLGFEDIVTEDAGVASDATADSAPTRDGTTNDTTTPGHDDARTDTANEAQADGQSVDALADAQADAQAEAQADASIDAYADATLDALIDAQTPVDAAPATCDAADTEHNCGRCGHDCLGGQCVNAMCTPVLIADSLGNPAYLAADNSNIYWGNAGSVGGVYACPSAGCDAGATQLGATTNITGIAASPTHVYWVASPFSLPGTLNRTPKAGLPDAGAETLLTGLVVPGSVAATAQKVYVTEATAKVKQCDPASCTGTLETVNNENYADNIYAANGDAYWVITNGGNPGIRRCSGALPCNTGSPVTLIGNRSGPTALAVTATDVLWLEFPSPDAGALMRCSTPSCTSPTTLASNLGKPFTLATDGTFVYWPSPDDATIKYCAIANCIPQVLASGQPGGIGVAVGGASLYWSTLASGAGSGTIYRVTRP